MQDRIAELEVRLAFQERTIQELNDVVTRQQQTIERLTRDVQVLRAQLQTLAPSLVGSREDEPPPPHY
ncbi:MAG: SlyX family protein [Pseudomonadota bacterium]|nr:MAG: SlyX family protein [Pseudomonadota bacterium]